MRPPRILRDGGLDPRPLLRGVLHHYAAFVAAAGGLLLLLLADSPRARLSVAIYGVSITSMFAVSAVYHRVWWNSLRARQWMRRLDHSTIFLAIAGTYTPFGLLLLKGRMAVVVLALVWLGGLAGVILNVAWVHAPRWLAAVAYLAVGWAGLLAMPQIWDHGGAAVLILVAIGGVLYSVGAVVYARRRPDPLPASFGYHEVFHALVAAAAAVHFAAVTAVVV